MGRRLPLSLCVLPQALQHVKATVVRVAAMLGACGPILIEAHCCLARQQVVFPTEVSTSSRFTAVFEGAPC